LNLVYRDVPRAFDHDLDAALPCPAGKLAEQDELLELAAVRGVGQAARPQAVAQAQDHVVPSGDLEEPVVLLVERVLAVVEVHPVGENRTPAADDPQEPALLLEAGDAMPRHAAVDGDEVHAVLAVLLDGLEELIGRHLHDGLTDVYGFHGSLVDRYGPHGDRRCPDDGSPDRPEVATGGEVHDRVRPRGNGDADLLHLQGHVGPVLRGADVRVDLRPQALADGQCRNRAVPVVADDDDRPVLHTPADRLGLDVFELRAEFHLPGEDPPSCHFQLCQVTCSHRSTL